MSKKIKDKIKKLKDSGKSEKEAYIIINVQSRKEDKQRVRRKRNDKKY